MNSRDKGKRGEREWAQVLRDMGFTQARRGMQFSGSPESPDVVGGIPNTHAEVKRVENLNINEAMKQAIRDSGPDQVPYVAHRRNGTPWLVTLLASDLERFSKSFVSIERKIADV